MLEEVYDRYAPYSEQIRIPFLFQGQYYDHEIELAYNRFRYYSPELGRYISEDPIGLDSGECNLFSYVENPTILLDLFGLAPWGGAGEQSFDLWWKKAKQKTVQKHIASVKRHLRAGGGKHEMFPVSIAMDAKRLGFIPSELRNMTLNTEDVVFHYGTYRGKHHKSTASSLFHQDLIAQLKVAKTKTEALRIIEDMHEKHVVGYKSKK